jgi:hypothetical protein
MALESAREWIQAASFAASHIVDSPRLGVDSELGAGDAVARSAILQECQS